MVGYYKPAVLSTHWHLWWMIIHWWVEDWLLFQVGGLNRQGSTPLLFRTCSSCSIWLRKTSALAYSSNTWACILTLKHLERVVFWKNIRCISVLLDALSVKAYKSESCGAFLFAKALVENSSATEVAALAKQLDPATRCYVWEKIFWNESRKI